MKKIISNAVFLISEGNNDIGYFVTPARLRLRSIDTYTSDMVFWTKAFLQVRLYKIHTYIYIFVFENLNIIMFIKQ